MQETKKTQVLSLGQEYPLEKEMATHSSILGNPTDRGAWWAPVHGVSNSEQPYPKRVTVMRFSIQESIYLYQFIKSSIVMKNKQ